MTAVLKEHRYTSGRRFYIVECDECHAALNSGHHYDDVHRHHAERLATVHNVTVHTTPELEPQEDTVHAERGFYVEHHASDCDYGTGHRFGPFTTSQEAHDHIATKANPGEWFVTR